MVNTNKGVPGKSRLALSFGFFTKCVDDQIALLSRVLTPEFFQLSPKTVPIPFAGPDMELQARALRIGYFNHDGFLPPVPG